MRGNDRLIQSVIQQVKCLPYGEWGINSNCDVVSKVLPDGGMEGGVNNLNVRYCRSKTHLNPSGDQSRENCC